MSLETYKYWTTISGKQEQRTAFRASKADKRKEREMMEARGYRYESQPVNQNENRYSFRKKTDAVE